MAPEDKDNWKEKMIKYNFLNELMGEIPGKDGYNNVLHDTGLDGLMAKVNASVQTEKETLKQFFFPSFDGT